MAYLNQPWFNREIVNRFAIATGVVHSETLTVTKRASKKRQKIPVTPVEVDGVKYLVSTRGESQWVKTSGSIRTSRSPPSPAPRNTSPTKRRSRRQPILDAYKVNAGKIVEVYFRKLPDPADHPVFTLTPGT